MHITLNGTKPLNSFFSRFRVNLLPVNLPHTFEKPSSFRSFWISESEEGIVDYAG